jgi:DNA-binding transcriptional MocR family regulator
MTAFATAAELAEHLESEILAGRLAPGDRLEPVRAAADDLDLAPNTVASAYRTLSERGLVIGRGRNGTFVADRRPSFTVEPVIGEDVIDCATGNPDPDLLPDLDAAIRRMVVPTTLYGDAPVLADFETAVRNRLIDPAGEMAVVSGALDGIERVLSAHLRPGDRVGIENPGWPAMADLMRAMLLRPIPIAIDAHGIRPDALAAVVGRLDAVVLTSRVQNPTGACITAERANELATVIERHPDLLTIEDDHAGSISGVEVFPIGPGRGRWALASSMSKALGPDLRIAALFGDRATVDRLRSRQAVGPGWVSHLLQRLAATVLETSGVALERATRIYAERRSRFIDELAGSGVKAEAPSGLNVWVPVTDPAATVAACLDVGFAVRSGDAFVMDDTRAVRVTTSRMTAPQASQLARVIGASVSPGRTHTRSG